jgi:hypothetical protein
MPSFPRHIQALFAEGRQKPGTDTSGIFFGGLVVFLWLDWTIHFHSLPFLFPPSWVRIPRDGVSRVGKRGLLVAFIPLDLERGYHHSNQHRTAPIST